MPNTKLNTDNHMKFAARELLKFYDELTALNACSAFVMQALSTALINSGGLDERSSTGGMFCVQWLNERTVEMEQRLKDIVAQAYSSTTTTSP